MSTLTGIGFTAVAGTLGFVVSMVSFGLATSKQSTIVAARCAARPETVIYNPNPSHVCQDRGNLYWGWMPWVMKLSYTTMLSGVPGTGTRDGGLAGLMLKVNLDGIVLIRFHHLCLRVSSLAALLYILIVLPVYRTAQCSRIGGYVNETECLQQNLTDYQRFTMANFPPLESSSAVKNGIIGFFLPEEQKLLPRLYVVVFVSWIVSWYTYVLLEKEWRDLLALRRVYFLEADHWSDRNTELEETLLREERESRQGTVDIEKGKSYAKTRDPWIHHPEQRDTVPNIELYSVLVGGLPSLPTEAFLTEDVKAVFSRKQSIEWQLAVTSAFFDHCVPNQPGFSSSVAAVTILPAASQVTQAWKHWYKTAAKVRRLRFIRQEIAQLKKEMNVYKMKKGVSQRRMTKQMKRKHEKTKKSFVYDESEEKKKYFNEVLGTTDDLNVTNNFLHSLNLGPEQTAVYSREFAQAAAKIAPNGWNESRIRNSSLEELLEMEKHAIFAVQEASQALQKAQEVIVESGSLCNDADVSDLMFSATKTNGISIEKNEFHEEVRDSDEEPTKTGESIGYPTNRHSHLRSLTQNLEIVGPISNASDPRSTQEKEFPTRNSRKNDRSDEIRSTPGLEALCLEAGLFLEQKVISTGISQKKTRNVFPRPTTNDDIAEQQRAKRAKSLFGSSQPDTNEDPHSRRRHVRSVDDLGLLPAFSERKKSSESLADTRLGRTLQSHDVDGRTESFAMSHSTERERLGYERHASDHVVRKIETKTDHHTNPIWKKLESEHDRRNRIRKRLHNISKNTNNGIQDKSIGDIDIKPTALSPSSVIPLRKTNNGHRCAEMPKKNQERSNVIGGSLFSIDESRSSNDLMKLDAAYVTNGVTSSADLGSSEKTLISSMADQGTQLTYAFEEKAGLRLRHPRSATERLSETTNEKWTKVLQISNENSSRHDKDGKNDPILSGSYSGSSIFESIITIFKNAFNLQIWRKRTTDMMDPFDLASESTFAVVTFTSRQAAVAARHCLADSRGGDRWNTITDLPSPPLADAPVSNLSSFVRPVTLSINDRQKMVRHTLTLALLGTIYIFYVIPLTQVQKLISPEYLEKIAPNLELAAYQAEYIFNGFVPAMIWTGFYAICPPLFKIIANFGSNATSAACAEGSAIRYFWWFMIVSAFTGTSLVNSFEEGEHDIRYTVISIASTIPNTVSAMWLNWIIVRALIVSPTQYILQMNTFIFSWLGVKSLARAIQGGGSGGPIPFRIYIDSGFVMLCLLALAPASPLVAIAVFVYFLFCVPMLRWVMIFLYKPQFDVGGARFPFIFDMCVSGMVAGKMLLGTMLLIRGAAGPAVFAFLPLAPIIFYRWILLKRYLKPFKDMALLQTSLLDGWDTNEGSCTSKREEFRQFLVDCHKAAYVPVCIACEKSTVITSEPAVVLPVDTDHDEDNDDTASVSTECGGDIESAYGSSRKLLYHPYEPHKQPGRLMRRASSRSFLDLAVSGSPNGWLSTQQNYFHKPSTHQKRVVRNVTSG